MFALNLDPHTDRVLSVTFPQYAPETAVIVETLPDGDISDYIYHHNAFILSPIPKPPEKPDTIDLMTAQISALSDRNDFLEDCVAEMAQIIYA